MRTRRLRDLHGRRALLALGLLLLVLVPFVVSLVRAYQHGFLPAGDEANIATRALDVFSRHPPLTGLPTTTLIYGKHIFTNHPGPIEFYLLAVPIRLLGQQTGPLLVACSINAAFVLIALWTIYRRAGLAVLLIAGLVMQGILWSVGTAVLSETLSSNMTMYSMLCTAVLAWALADGDVALLPLTALVASYAAQQHLAAGPIVFPVIAVGLAALVVGRIARARRGETADEANPRPYVLGAAVIAGLCWLPVAIEQIKDHPGNLTNIVKFARDDSRPTLGLHAGLTQLVHAITPPTLLTQTQVSGNVLNLSVSPARAAVAIIVVVVVIAIAVFAWSRLRALASLAGMTLVVFVVGALNGANVPQGPEVVRPNEYRWAWIAAFLAGTTIGWAVLVLVRHTSLRRYRIVPAVAVLVAIAFVATTTAVVSGSDDVPFNAATFALNHQFDRAVLHHVDHHRPVAVFFEGGDLAAVDIAWNVVFALVQAGIRVELAPGAARAQSLSRGFDGTTNPAALIVATGKGDAARVKGTVIASHEFDAAYGHLLDTLLAQTAREPVRLAPDARARAERLIPGSFPAVQRLLRAYRSDPRAVLPQPLFSGLILKGVLRAPGISRTQLRRLAVLETHRTQFLGADRVTITQLTPGQLRALPPRQLHWLLST